MAFIDGIWPMYHIVIYVARPTGQRHNVHHKIVMVYSATSIIRSSQRSKNTLPHMRRRRDQWSFMGVVTDWVMSYGLYRLALAKTDWPKYFSEHCWPWSYCIGIIYRLGIINQARNIHFSYPDISLLRYGSDRPVDKGVWIIKVALYLAWSMCRS